MFSSVVSIVAIAAIAASSCTALSLPNNGKFGTTRSHFIHSTASTIFFADFSRIVSGAPSSAACADDSPRYIDSDVQMKYGDDSKGNPRTRGMLVRRFTGDSTPYTFPSPRPVSLVKEWPETPPFTQKDFFRADEGDDETFYNLPRLVYHIDEPAAASLTQYYRANIPPGSSILDICSSWVSHYPLEFKKVMKRISGTGMNALELLANDQFTDYEARNLNVNPTLPYEDNSFDVITCVVSIDYLIHPIEVLQEVSCLILTLMFSKWEILLMLSPNSIRFIDRFVGCYDQGVKSSSPNPTVVSLPKQSLCGSI